MSNLQMIKAQKGDTIYGVSLEEQIDKKRQEINELQIELSVIEAQMRERYASIERSRAEYKNTWSIIRITSKVFRDVDNADIVKKDTSQKVEKNNKELTNYLAILSQYMKAETDVLSTERIEFARISQKLANAKKDLGFLNRKFDRIKNTTVWMSGSFYVFATILIIAALAVVSSLLPWYSVGVVFASGLLSMVIIGAFQLRNDDSLSEENFIYLIKEAFKKLPSILRTITPKK